MTVVGIPHFVESHLKFRQLLLLWIETILSSVALIVHIQLQITKADILSDHLGRSFILNAFYC